MYYKLTAEQFAISLIEQFKPKCGGNSQPSLNNQLAIQCAIICVEKLIVVQSDFYGLVFTPIFRERINRKINYLEATLLVLESKLVTFNG